VMVNVVEIVNKTDKAINVKVELEMEAVLCNGTKVSFDNLDIQKVRVILEKAEECMDHYCKEYAGCGKKKKGRDGHG